MENWFSKTFQDYWLLYRRVSSSSSTSIPCRLPWHHRLFLFLLFLLRIRELVFRFVHIYTVQHTALQISLLMYSSSSAHFPSVSFFPTGMIGLYVSFAFGGGNSSSSRCFSACHHSSSCAAVFLGTLVVRYSIPYRPLYIPVTCRKRKEEQLVHCEFFTQLTNYWKFIDFDIPPPLASIWWISHRKALPYLSVVVRGWIFILFDISLTVCLKVVYFAFHLQREGGWIWFFQKCHALVLSCVSRALSL